MNKWHILSSFVETLKNPHVSCLYYLFIEKELTARDLFSICDEDKASISSFIEYLEINEYVICETNEKKKSKSLITISSKLSGTYESAIRAKEKFKDKVFVVDSLHACIGERLLC